MGMQHKTKSKTTIMNIPSIKIDLIYFMDCFEGEELSENAKKIVTQSLAYYDSINPLENE